MSPPWRAGESSANSPAKDIARELAWPIDELASAVALLAGGAVGTIVAGPVGAGVGAGLGRRRLARLGNVTLPD